MKTLIENLYDFIGWCPQHRVRKDWDRVSSFYVCAKCTEEEQPPAEEKQEVA